MILELQFKKSLKLNSADNSNRKCINYKHTDNDIANAFRCETIVSEFQETFLTCLCNKIVVLINL